MAKIVVAIPYWECDPEKRQILNECINSFEGYDQLLVLAGKQASLPIAWNMCCDIAFDTMKADYVILSNDDVILNKGNLMNLCVKDTVLSPTVNNSVFKVFHAHIFALPKEIWKKIGRFDERYQVYWVDTDYAKRMVDAGVKIGISEAVNVIHKHPGRTVGKFAGLTEQHDKEEFVKKWGREYFDPAMGK